MVVLISGITSGFGRAMAEKFSSEGHKVYGTHRRDSDPVPGVVYIKADSASDAEVEAAVKQVTEAEGRIDIFINNAGMGIGGPLEFSSLEDARKQMDINWMGMVRYIHYVLPVMRAQGSGTIVTVSSIGGLMGLPYQGLYSASKFAIEGYCESLRLELRGTPVKVVVIEPGDFATGFTASRKSVPAAEVAEAYPGYARSLASIEHDENSGLKPEYLAGKVYGIVQKKKPGYSYVIASPLQKLSVFAKRILPAKWFAWILGIYYKV